MRVPPHDECLRVKASDDMVDVEEKTRLRRGEVGVVE
jgi:hypothetical protein